MNIEIRSIEQLAELIRRRRNPVHEKAKTPHGFAYAEA
jgi:hypothetical protein